MMYSTMLKAIRYIYCIGYPSTALVAYIRMNQDPDFEEDEYMYDDLNLEDDEELYTIATDEYFAHNESEWLSPIQFLCWKMTYIFIGIGKPESKEEDEKPHSKRAAREKERQERVKEKEREKEREKEKEEEVNASRKWLLAWANMFPHLRLHHKRSWVPSQVRHIYTRSFRWRMMLVWHKL